VDAPHASVFEFIAYAKANPGKISFGTNAGQLDAPRAIVKTMTIDMFTHSLRLPKNFVIVVTMVVFFITEGFNR